MAARKSVADARKSFAASIQRDAARRTTTNEQKCKEFNEIDYEPLDRLASHGQYKTKKRFGLTKEG